MGLRLAHVRVAWRRNHDAAAKAIGPAAQVSNNGISPGSGTASLLASLVAVLSAALGLIVERWLFFAEAKHTVMLYYGAETV